MLFSSHLIKDMYYQYDLSMLNLTFVTWLVHFLHRIVSIFFPYSTLYSLEESHYVQPTLMEWEVMLYHFKDGVAT